MTTPNDLPARWYCVTNYGAATLCVDEDDARKVAAETDEMYPRNGPHVAVQLAPLSSAVPSNVVGYGEVIDGKLMQYSHSPNGAAVTPLCVAASAEPVAFDPSYKMVATLLTWMPGKWENGKPVTEDQARDILVKLYTHAQPAAPQSVPVESLGRDGGTCSRRCAETLVCDNSCAPALASVPEGWQLVPIVATRAMVSSGWESGKLVGDTRVIVSVSGVWDAMLSTAAAHNNPASDYALCCDTPAYCSSVRRCTATDAVRDGPQTITKKVCDGCPHLKTEWWKDYLDNDETDSGTMAICTLAGKNINAYWGKEDPPPIWCPIAPPTNQEGAAP